MIRWSAAPLPAEPPMTMMSRLAIGRLPEAQANNRHFRSNSRNEGAGPICGVSGLIRAELVCDQSPMLPMLAKQRTEVGQQLLGSRGGKTALAQARDQLFLTNDMPLALCDMIVDHLQIGCRVGHSG